MADKRPAFILKDCNLNIDTNTRIGQVSEMVFPVPEVAVETIRNAGMVKPREVRMGYEVTTASFKETAFDPDIMRLWGLGPGSQTPMIGTGYMESEDGSEHVMRFEMETMIKKMDLGSWSPGNKGEVSYDVAVHESALFHGEQEIIRVTDFQCWVFGELQQPLRSSAFGLS